jgi:hypothetical protein
VPYSPPSLSVPQALPYRFSLILYPEDIGVMFLRNVDTSQPNDTALTLQDSDRHHIINRILQFNLFEVQFIVTFLSSQPSNKLSPITLRMCFFFPPFEIHAHSTPA